MSSKIARLDLNFAPPRRNAPMGWLLLGAGLIAATVAGVQFRNAHAERLVQANDLSAITGRANPLAATDEAAALDPRATKAAAAVARDLQIPWAEMLSALEAVPARDVALLGVEPSPLRHTIRVTAEAKTAESMLNYVDAMRGNSFPEVNLMSHQTQVQTPGTPVRFIVQARWRAL
jgi:hypothetical protein